MRVEGPEPVIWASIFTAVVAGLVLWAATSTPAGVAELFHPGAKAASAGIVRADFPETPIAPGPGHDGQQFYAIARQPMHLDEVSESLDRPRYRLQRPLFSWLAWTLHPSGGGAGLAISMFIVGTLAVLLLALTSTRLSVMLGSTAWPAVVVPLMPGVWASLRIGVADTLALGLALLSMALALEGRRAGAAVAGAAGVLAKEATLVILVGQAFGRRRPPEIVAALTAASTTAAWWLFLRVSVEADRPQIIEFTWPFGGAFGSASHWLAGEELIGAANYAAVCLVAVVALVRSGPRHPIFGGLASATLLSVFLGKHVVGPDYNGTRTLMPLLLLGLLVITTRFAGSRRCLDVPSEISGG